MEANCHQQIEEWIQEALQRGQIIPVPPDFPKVVQPIFPIIQNKKLRVIYDARFINHFIPQNKFRLCTPSTVFQVFSFDSIIFSVDLKKAYLQMMINGKWRQLNCFCFPDSKGNKRYFCFTGMPFGISEACHRFQRTFVRYIVDYLCRVLPSGAVLQYIDDVIAELASASENLSNDQIQARAQFILYIFKICGIRLSNEKTTTPSTFTEWLGMNFDTREGTFCPTTHKFQKVLDKLTKLCESSSCSLRRLAEISGSLRHIGGRPIYFLVRFFDQQIAAHMPNTISQFDLKQAWSKCIKINQQFISVVQEIIAHLITFHKNINLESGNISQAFICTDASDDTMGGFYHTPDNQSKLWRMELPPEVKVEGSLRRERHGIRMFLESNISQIESLAKQFDRLIIINDNCGNISTLQSRKPLNQIDHIDMSKILHICDNIPCDVHFRWNRRNTMAMVLADSLSRPPPEFFWKPEQKFFKLLAKLCPKYHQHMWTFSNKILCSLNALEPFQPERDNLILEREGLIFLPPDDRICKRIIKFLRARHARGILILPFFQNKPHFILLKRFLAKSTILTVREWKPFFLSSPQHWQFKLAIISFAF